MDDFGCFFLLLLLWILATFTSAPQIGKHNGKKSLAGRETPCLWRTEKPQNCTPKMPNVTSETHRKWCFWLLFPLGTPKMPNVTSETHRKWRFWLLFPLAAAMNFGYLYIRSPNGKTQWKKITCRQGNTMPLKDGEAPKLHPENA